VQTPCPGFLTSQNLHLAPVCPAPIFPGVIVAPSRPLPPRFESTPPTCPSNPSGPGRTEPPDPPTRPHAPGPNLPVRADTLPGLDSPLACAFSPLAASDVRPVAQLAEAFNVSNGLDALLKLNPALGTPLGAAAAGPVDPRRQQQQQDGGVAGAGEAGTGVEQQAGASAVVPLGASIAIPCPGR
jgi:hypothetical protein